MMNFAAVPASPRQHFIDECVIACLLNHRCVSFMHSWETTKSLTFIVCLSFMATNTSALCDNSLLNTGPIGLTGRPGPSGPGAMSHMHDAMPMSSMSRGSYTTNVPIS